MYVSVKKEPSILVSLLESSLYKTTDMNEYIVSVVW